MKRATVILAVVALLVFAAGQGRAAILTFTNRTAWENAVGSVSTTDFDAEATGTFTSRDFGPFTASKTSPDLTIGVFGGGANTLTLAQNTTAPNGTNHLFFQANFTQSPLTLTFDTPVSAVGFDWRTTDSTQDGLDLVVDAMLFNVNLASPGTGFFGVIKTDGTFNSIALQDDPDGGGFNEGVGIDNVSIGANAVPEPTSLAVFGLATLTAAGYFGWRRKRTST